MIAKHFQQPGARLALCGRGHVKNTTTDPAAVTCRDCLKYVRTPAGRKVAPGVDISDLRDFAAMEAQVNTVVAKAREVLNDHAPPGYDAHRDRLADAYDHAEAVNKLAKALRELLEAVTP